MLLNVVASLCRPFETDSKSFKPTIESYTRRFSGDESDLPSIYTESNDGKNSQIRVYLSSISNIELQRVTFLVIVRKCENRRSFALNSRPRNFTMRLLTFVKTFWSLNKKLCTERLNRWLVHPIIGISILFDIERLTITLSPTRQQTYSPIYPYRLKMYDINSMCSSDPSEHSSPFGEIVNSLVSNPTWFVDV